MKYQEHKLKLVKDPEFRKAWKSLRWWYLRQKFLIRMRIFVWRREMNDLTSMLDRLAEEMSGYILGYNDTAITKYKPEPYHCWAWFTEYGAGFHGYGWTKEEAARDCLGQVLEFKEGFE